MIRGFSQIFFGMVLGALFVSGCATAAYKWYTLDVSPSCYTDGMLLGEKESDDIPLTRCLAGNGDINICSVIFNAELNRMLDRIDALEQQLKFCEEQAQKD